VRFPFVAANPMQEPFIWMEGGRDFRKDWPKAPFLDEEQYGLCMAAFPRVCSDIIAVHPQREGFYLARRIHHSAMGRWCFGGGQRRGQTPRDAAAANLRRETGIEVPPEKFTFLFATEMYWKHRNPQPQNLGEQCRVLTYCFVPTNQEVANIKLDPNEYDPEHGVQLYTKRGIYNILEPTGELLRMYWHAAFG